VLPGSLCSVNVYAGDKPATFTGELFKPFLLGFKGKTVHFLFIPGNTDI